MKDNKLGYFAVSISGRDKDKTYLIISENNGYYKLVNGDNKTIETPKIKNSKHIKVFNDKHEKIAQKIQEKTKVFNAEIYSAIKKYNESLSQEEN